MPYRNSFVGFFNLRSLQQFATACVHYKKHFKHRQEPKDIVWADVLLLPESLFFHYD